MKKKILSIITITLLLSTISLVNAATEDEIIASIEAGLPWLAAAQNPDGSWGIGEWVAHTGLAVLKFIDRAVEMEENPFDPSYEYSSQVIGGLDYLFLNAYTMTISVEPHGDPDSDGDGIGVYFESPGGSHHRTYSTGISLMAIATAAKVDGSRTVSGGTLNGWTYSDIVQDTVDYAAYGQNDAGNERGGWGYHDNDVGWSDNSNAGWMTLGLGYGANAGATVPQFVYDELNVWVGYIQSTDGGSGYTAPNNWENTLKTGNLLYQMALVGDTADTPRVEDAVDYLVAHWSDANQDPGWMGSGGSMNYQAAYCIMKGLESLGIATIGPAEIDWFDELSTRIVETQHADGHWSGDDWGSDILATSWALLTLEKTVAIPVIEVDVDIKPGSWPNPLLKGSKGVISVAMRARM